MREIPAFSELEINRVIPDFGIAAHKKEKKFTQVIYAAAPTDDKVRHAPDGTLIYDESANIFYRRVGANWYGVAMTTSTSTSTSTSSTSTSTSTTA